MHELKEELKPLCEICDNLKSYLKMGICGDSISIAEAGQVTDMIKDLYQAKKDCYKAKYYEEVAESMKKAEEEPHYGESRMGYDHWRYSNGEFAPTGHGHVSGYKYPPDTWTRPWMASGDRMGYSDRMPKTSYDNYRDARRFYTETHNEEDRKKMEGHADKHIHESIETIKDIWADASPEHKRKMKMEIMELVNQMNV